MAILVTGGAGYIGSHMTWRLVDQQEKVVVLDNLSTGFHGLVPPSVKLIEGDIGDRELVANVLREEDIEAVIHFAGSIVVPESVSDPLKYYENNTVKSRNLIESCVKSGVDKFIFSSTATVYGEPDLGQLDEDLPLLPINPYATSKVMTEWMLRDVALAHDFRYIAIRYFNVAGADPQGRSGQSSKNATHLIKVASQVALGEREKLQVFGTDYDTPDGTCIRDYVHVTDLISAHMDGLTYLRDGGASVAANCGYGHGYSVFDVIKALNSVIEDEIPVEITERRPGDAQSLVAKPEKIKSLFGWKPQHDDLEFVVKTALDWERTLPEKNWY